MSIPRGNEGSGWGLEKVGGLPFFSDDREAPRVAFFELKALTFAFAYRGNGTPHFLERYSWARPRPLPGLAYCTDTSIPRLNMALRVPFREGSPRRGLGRDHEYHSRN